MEHPQKAIVLGGSHSELRLVEALNRLGIHVILIGNNSAGLAVRKSNEYIEHDYSDWQAIVKIAKKSDVSFIVSAANDFSIFSAAKVSTALNLPGFDEIEVLENLHHKQKYKSLLKEMCVLSPQLVYSGSVSCLLSQWEDLRKTLDYKKRYLFKPVDLGSGIGISEVSKNAKIEEIVERVADFTREKTCLIEEFVPGSLHSFSAFIQKQKIVKSFVADEWLKPNTYLVNRSMYPSQISQSQAVKLKAFTETLAKKMNLANGLIHHQFILNENGCYIIETTRRIPGDLYGDNITSPIFENYYDFLLSIQYGLKLKSRQSAKQRAFKTERHIIWSDDLRLDKNLVNEKIISELDISSQYRNKLSPHRTKIVLTQSVN